MAKYKLKEGVVLEPYGERSSITNENLTDVIAAHLLEHGRAKLEDFETVDEEAFPTPTPADQGGDGKVVTPDTSNTGKVDPAAIVIPPVVDGGKGDSGKSKQTPTPADQGGDSKK